MDCYCCLCRLANGLGLVLFLLFFIEVTATQRIEPSYAGAGSMLGKMCE